MCHCPCFYFSTEPKNHYITFLSLVQCCSSEYTILKYYGYMMRYLHDPHLILFDCLIAAVHLSILIVYINDCPAFYLTAFILKLCLAFSWVLNLSRVLAYYPQFVFGGHRGELSNIVSHMHSGVFVMLTSFQSSLVALTLSGWGQISVLVRAVWNWKLEETNTTSIW